MYEPDTPPSDNDDDAYWDALGREASGAPAAGGDPIGSREDEGIRHKPTRPRRDRVDIDKDRVLAVLKDVFGYDTFRPGQREVIEAALDGTDCLPGYVQFLNQHSLRNAVNTKLKGLHNENSSVRRPHTGQT